LESYFNTELVIQVPNGVTNPLSTKQSSPFQFTSYLADSLGTFYKVDQDLTSLTVTANTAND
jgi:hypothetical protein